MVAIDRLNRGPKHLFKQQPYIIALKSYSRSAKHQPIVSKVGQNGSLRLILPPSRETHLVRIEI